MGRLLVPAQSPCLSHPSAYSGVPEVSRRANHLLRRARPASNPSEPAPLVPAWVCRLPLGLAAALCHVTELWS